MGKQGEQIIAAAQGMVDGAILGAAFAKPRGATTAVAGGGLVTGEIGAQWSGGLAVTASDFITMEVGVSFTGQIKQVKAVKSVVPLEAIDSVEVKRVGMAGVMEIHAGESSFKVEGKVDDLRDFAEAFGRAKAARAG
jgi:hypothetical protein